MRYVLARVSMNIREEAYRFYLGEGIRFISENTAKYVTDGHYVTKSWIDFIKFKSDKDEAEENERKANTIVRSFLDNIERYK